MFIGLRQEDISYALSSSPVRTFFEITVIFQVRPSIRHSAQKLPGRASGNLLVRCLRIIIELYAFSLANLGRLSR